MAATIEWLLEEVDGDEIVNVHHAESYAQAVSWQENDTEYNVGLVRDLPRGGRSWAYIEDGKLPEYFTDAYGEETAKVPAKYHREIA
jgi:hypothetical protein